MEFQKVSLRETFGFSVGNFRFLAEKLFDTCSFFKFYSL